jgi:hypothetical protein
MGKRNWLDSDILLSPRQERWLDVYCAALRCLTGEMGPTHLKTKAKAAHEFAESVADKALETALDGESVKTDANECTCPQCGVPMLSGNENLRSRFNPMTKSWEVCCSKECAEK